MIALGTSITCHILANGGVSTVMMCRVSPFTRWFHLRKSNHWGDTFKIQHHNKIGMDKPRHFSESGKMYVDVFWNSAPGECVSVESWSQWCGVELILAALINWDSQSQLNNRGRHWDTFTEPTLNILTSINILFYIKSSVHYLFDCCKSIQVECF